ncbi:hypothetical protein Syun_012382 [Stephania yunnanensis]|uniref:Uncharacterized protein n=1 Tax=Stephania yunnanensis TaxID=152371 RepID=A0AAP0K1R0_9MAGN
MISHSAYLSNHTSEDTISPVLFDGKQIIKRDDGEIVLRNGRGGLGFGELGEDEQARRIREM